MSDHLVSSINVELLKKIRIESGLTLEEAAKNILPPSKLAKVENSEDKLTFNQFYEIANRYKMPITFFYYQSEPEMGLLKHFRSVKSGEMKISPKLRKVFYEIDEKRDLCMELQEYDEDFPQYNYDFLDFFDCETTPPSQVADYIRKWVRYSESSLRSFKSEYDALNFWKLWMEQQGILVFQFSNVDIKELRGFCIAKKPYPVIAINRKDNAPARTFSILHEFTHLLIKKTDAYAFSSGKQSKSSKAIETHKKVEQFCNAVAGEVLVQSNLLLSHNKVANHQGADWNDPEINSIAHHFRVSKEVILRRLLDEKIINQTVYSSKIHAWENMVGKEKPGGRETPAEKAYRTHPQVFLTLVMKAYADQKLTSNKLSRYLGMKIKHLDQFQRLFEGTEK
jgi:Zn-dependent peptidase ImmA (M78 family)